MQGAYAFCAILMFLTLDASLPCRLFSSNLAPASVQRILTHRVIKSDNKITNS